MKLFIEYILDEIEQIGLKKAFAPPFPLVRMRRITLEAHYSILIKTFYSLCPILQLSRKNPNLTYTFWILNHHGNEQLLKNANDKESEEAENKKKKIDLIKEHCLSEINVNISKGEEIQKLFKKIETVLSKEVIMS
ncbi:hypothetical protein AAHH67_23625 [Niallia circulans]